MQFIEKLTFFRAHNITTFLHDLMKYAKLLIAFTLAFTISTSLQARQLTIQPAGDHSGNSTNQFPLDNGLLEEDRGYITIGEAGIFNPESWSISFSGKKVSFLEDRDGTVYYSNFLATGEMASELELEFFDPADETMNVYSFDDGRAIARDNVANFSYFSASGELLYSQSNSSQSSDGERESQLASDALGQTVVLYNPVISFGDTRGSQANLLYGEEDTKRFFNSQTSEIKEIKVSQNGSFISLLTSDNKVYLFDRFGNELAEQSFEDEQVGVSLTGDGAFLTVYSRSRVQVLSTSTGERLGSTSSRSPVVYATYEPEDDTILIFGGSIDGNQINDPMVTAVNISQRQILREEVSMPLAMHDIEKLRIDRTGASQYRLSGLNRPLIIQASF